MPSALHLRNCCKALPSPEFEALCPHLGLVELVRETVLVEAGAPLTHVYLPPTTASFRADDRRAAQCGLDRCARASAGRHYQL
jgi:hypothetical protein